MTPTDHEPAQFKLVLVGNYRPDGQFSMLRYAEMLERLMQGGRYGVARISPPAVLGRLRFLRGGWAKWVRYIDKYLLGIPWLRWKCRGFDVVHVCDHSNAMYLWCAGKKPRLITCHDLLGMQRAHGNVPGEDVGWTGRMLQRWILRSLLRAEYILCDSMNTESELRARGSKATLKVVYLSLNRDYFPAGPDAVTSALERFGLPADCRYLLHVGGNQWYKNRPGAMRIFAALKRRQEFAAMKLLVVGVPWTAEMREYRRSAGLENSIIETGIVTDDELRALYSGASALLFPSLKEGFGWPVLEAQACGCPVITTNRRPMTEVAGDAAILIEDPTNPDEAASVIADRWPALPELRERGFRNLKRFSDAAMAAACSRAYEEVLERWGDAKRGNPSQASIR